MSVIEINGRAIGYSDSGGPGPVVLMAHGFFMDRSMFDAQVSGLHDDCRVVTWDARGHGDSPDLSPDLSYTYWDQADDANGLLDALGIESAIVCGMSQGGFTTLRFALRYPDRVNAIALIGSEARSCTAEQIAGYEAMFADWSANGPIDRIAEPLAMQLLGDSTPSLRAEWIGKWQRSTADPSLIWPAARCLVYRDDVVAQLPRITCPAAVIHGDADPAVPQTTAEETTRLLGGDTRLWVVPEGSHSVNLTHPEPVNSALRDLVHRAFPDKIANPSA